MSNEAESVPTETDSGKNDTLDDKSIASVKSPDLAEGSVDQHVFLWGRFWNESESLAVAFALDFQLKDLFFQDESILVFENPSQVKDLKPGNNFFQFKHQLTDLVSSNSVPDATIKQVEESLKNFLRELETDESLLEDLKEKNSQNFDDPIYKLVTSICKKGASSYEINGKLGTHDNNQQVSSSSTGKQEKTEEDQQQDDDEENFITVKPVTKPLTGKFPVKLSIGDPVFVRIVGSGTQNLPENLQEDNSEEMSVPLEVTVRSIDVDFTAPPNFDGSEEDYWKLTVNMLDGMIGQCYIHKDTEIKSPETEDENRSTSFFLSPLFLIAMGLSMLSIVFLAYFLFEG